MAGRGAAAGAAALAHAVDLDYSDVQATEEFCRFLGEGRRRRGALLDLIQAQVLLDRREHQLCME